MFTLPTLYKKTNTGAVQQWTVSVDCNPDHSTAYDVHTIYGQVGGAMTPTSDTVFEGKNLGKKNATTPMQQAQLQAQQTWDKKKKQGYVEDMAVAAVTDNALEAIKPMLAHVYEDHPKKVQWPAYVQPKLDGMRCIAIVKDRKCKLYSRTQKPIETVPHIVAALENLARGLNRDFILDGELYNHVLKHDFNRIMSIIKRDEVHPECKVVQFHVYDMPSVPAEFLDRMLDLKGLLHGLDDDHPLQFVETEIVGSEEEMMARMEQAIEAGYEGLMYRNPKSLYEGKRSHGLLKVKTFKDAEFEVCGVEEGNGRLQGKAGAIWCYTDATKEKKFKAKMQGTLESLTDYLVNFHNYNGKQLTVKFQNLTPDGIPRFPVGIRFREAE